MPTSKTTKHQPFDLLMVFGQGPVKEIRLTAELSHAEMSQWKTWKKDPLQEAEPDFYVIEETQFLTDLALIALRSDIGAKRKHHLISAEESAWQQNPRFVLKRLGKLNALAAGMLLLEGRARQLLISGGHTMRQKTKERLQEQFFDAFPEVHDGDQEAVEKKFASYVKYFLKWPSEAVLMADFIADHFGQEYKERFGKPIREVLILETEGKNTLENFTLSLNKEPSLAAARKRIGAVSVTHHLPRIKAIGKLLHVPIAEDGLLSSQEVLMARYLEFHQTAAAEQIAYTEDTEHNAWLQELAKGEKRWLRGLNETEYLTYWLGYVFELNDAKLIGEVLQPLLSSRIKHKVLLAAVAQTGVDYKTLKEMSLPTLARKHPAEFKKMITELKSLTEPPLRALPPLDKSL